jgi:acyl carrier protein
VPKNLSVSKEVLEQWLKENLANYLGLNAEDIESNASFERYGLDSAKAVELSGDLSNWLKIPIGPDLCYDYPTVEKITQYLLEELGDRPVEL